MEAEKLAMTVEEYLEHTKTSTIKYEWVQGQAWAMTGGRLRHQAVGANVLAAFTFTLRGRPCRPTSSDQRIYIAATGNYYYADVSVVCGRFERPEQDSHSIVNPAILVEVLSPSTRNYDLGGKFDDYRLIPTLRDVLFIDPAKPHVVHMARTEEGWLRRDLSEGTVTLTALPDLQLTFDEIYADLDDVPAD